MRSLLVFNFLLILYINFSYSQNIDFTLKKCLRLALKNNLSIKASKFKLQSTKAGLSFTKTKRLPKIFLGSYASIAKFGGGIPVSNNLLLSLDQYKTRFFFYGEGGIYSRWLLYDNKKTYYEIKEKEELIEISKNYVKQRQSKILFQTAYVYYNAGRAREKIRLKQEQVNYLKQLKFQVTNYYKIGLLSKSDLEKFEIQLFNFEDELLLRHFKFRHLINKLHIILNIPKKQTINIGTFDGTNFCEIETISNNNLEIKQAEFAVSVNKLKVKQTKRHNSFQINLDTFLRYSISYSWVVGIGIDWPIWDFGETKAFKDMAHCKLMASQTELKLINQKVTQEIEENYENVLLTRKRLNLFSDKVDSLNGKNILSDNIKNSSIDELIITIDRKIEYLNLCSQKIDREYEYYLANLNYLKSINGLEELIKN